ncbi:MAG TPA: helix-turn-helix domain-containing protein [Galbitalea sp.]|nr:helix-turn-helix domain-containing protein [Galbitalea sp.]
MSSDKASEAQLALDWLIQLSPPPGAPSTESAISASLADRASRLLGRFPLEWAIDVGRLAAERIVRELPEFGGSKVAFETLRRGTESSTVVTLLVLAGDEDVTTVSVEALDGVVDYVRRGISMQSLLRGIRLGHAEIAAAFLAGCESLVDPARHNDQIPYVSARLFEYIDNFSAALTERYSQEKALWSSSKSAAALEMVRAILRGDTPDAASTSRTLGYALAPDHISMHVWSESSSDDVEGLELQRVTTEILRRVGATQRLIVPVGGGRVWSWFSTGETLRNVVSVVRSQEVPEDIAIALGVPGAGIAGFRQTHRDALATFDLMQILDALGPIVTYQEVDLVSLLLADRNRALEFVRRELGPLAAMTDQARDLRQTLLVYLDEESSPHASAVRMQVARNTISYRVHRAEDLMQRQITDRRHQLHSALLMASVLGDLTESVPTVR